MKNRLFFMDVFVSVAMILLSCTYSDDITGGQSSSDKQTQGVEQKIKEIRTNLINQYNPIIFPPKHFVGRKVFTYSLQKYLLNEKSRYVLFEGYLNDITREQSYFVIHFTALLSDDFLEERKVNFHLITKYEAIEYLIENPPPHDYLSNILFSLGLQKDFFVVCSITDVKKIINYSVQGHSSEGTDEVELEVQSFDTFSVNGKLIDMVNYPIEK